jgi:hypothetical protein
MSQDQDTITITKEQLDQLLSYSWSALEREWDAHTSKYICTDTCDEGMRRMDQKIYDLIKELRQKI